MALTSTASCSTKLLGPQAAKEIAMGAPPDPAKKGYEGFGRRDIPALLELLSDDVEWRFLGKPDTGTPYGGTFKGKQEVVQFFEKLAQSDEIMEFEPREFHEGPG